MNLPAHGFDRLVERRLQRLLIRDIRTLIRGFDIEAFGQSVKLVDGLIQDINERDTAPELSNCFCRCEANASCCWMSVLKCNSPTQLTSARNDKSFAGQAEAIGDFDIAEFTHVVLWKVEWRKERWIWDVT